MHDMANLTSIYQRSQNSISNQIYYSTLNESIAYLMFVRLQDYKEYRVFSWHSKYIYNFNCQIINSILKISFINIFLSGNFD